MALLDSLLAKAPTAADDLVLVGIDHGDVRVDRVVVDTVRTWAGTFVDVDVRPGHHGGDIPIHNRFAAARAGLLAAVNGDDTQAFEHGRCRPGTEVAAVEGLNVRAGERFELVQSYVLPGPEITSSVETGCTVGIRDVVVSQAVRLFCCRLRRRTGGGGVRRMGEAFCLRRSGCGSRCGAPSHVPDRLWLGEIIEPYHRENRMADGDGYRNGHVASCRTEPSGSR